jgi:hypothetical protein
MTKKTNVKRRMRSRAKTSPTPGMKAVSTSLPKLQAPLKPGKRVSIGEALRKRGLDEHKFAETFASAGNNLTEKPGEPGGVKKADFDYLKEWSRYLEPPRPADREVTDRPLPFILVHHVARPVRELVAENRKVKIENGDSTPSDDELRNCSAGLEPGRC